MALSGLDEESKFLKFIPDQKWPVASEFTRQNMVRSTAFDSAIKSYMVNENDKLPNMLELLQEFDTHLAKDLGKIFKIER